MNFASDNHYGVHPRILESLSEANAGSAMAYGGDDWTKKSEKMLSEVFEKEIRVFWVATGTAANGLSLSAITPPYGAVLCHSEAHIIGDECNSAEFFTAGAKIIGLQGPGGKITATIVEKCLKGFVRGERDPKPKAVSITNATEFGTVYSADDIKAISKLIRPRGLKLHMDGSRFANALAGVGCSPAELTWKAGVDLMSFGATKNGAMLLDAVIFFDLQLAEDFAHRRVRAGQHVSKARFLGAQMSSYLRDGLWIDNARRANALARKLAEGLQQSSVVRIAHPVEANMVYAILPRALNDRLIASGVKFHPRMANELVGQIKDAEIVVRLVLSFATPEADVDRLLELVRAG
jgi:threonine aldolase